MAGRGEAGLELLNNDTEVTPGFLTPLLSTLLLLAVRGERPSATVGIAAAMIVGGAVLGTRSR